MFGHYEMKKIIRMNLDKYIKKLCEFEGIRYVFTCAATDEREELCRLWTFYLPKTCYFQMRHYLISEISKIEKDNPIET